MVQRGFPSVFPPGGTNEELLRKGVVVPALLYMEVMKSWRKIEGGGSHPSLQTLIISVYIECMATHFQMYTKPQHTNPCTHK